MDDFWNLYDDSVQELILVLIIMIIDQYHAVHYIKYARNLTAVDGEAYTRDLLSGNVLRFYDLLRMPLHTFLSLYDWLSRESSLRDSKEISAVQKLAIFIYIVGYAQTFRVVGERFRHSINIISKQVFSLCFTVY